MGLFTVLNEILSELYNKEGIRQLTLLYTQPKGITYSNCSLCAGQTEYKYRPSADTGKVFHNPPSLHEAEGKTSLGASPERGGQLDTSPVNVAVPASLSQMSAEHDPRWKIRFRYHQIKNQKDHGSTIPSTH